MNKEMTASFVPSSANPIHFDQSKCIGCNRCVNACPNDNFLPNEEEGKCPIIMYPGECMYCGACVMECEYGAIKLAHPLMNQSRFVEIK